MPEAALEIAERIFWAGSLENRFRFAIPAEAPRGFEASRLGSFEASWLTITWNKSEARLEGFIRVWDHFLRMNVTLEPFWGHFRVTLACEGNFGNTLESLFVYDGDFVTTLGHSVVTFGS